MDDTIDELQLKIDKARSQLSENTIKAIDAVPWQATILKMREEKGYSFEQLGELETETELLLCGLLSSASYLKEIQNRMKISEGEANELVNYMNREVFSRIREKLISNNQETPAPIIPEKAPNIIKIIKPVQHDTEEEHKKNTEVLSSHGIEIIPEKLELSGGVPPILAQKFSAPVQVEIKKTEHTLENITKTNTPVPQAPTPVPKAPNVIPPPPTSYPPKKDPYRLAPEE